MGDCGFDGGHDHGYTCPECGGFDGYHDYNKHSGVGGIRPENSVAGFVSIIIGIFGFCMMIACPPVGALIIAGAAKLGNW